MRAPRSWLYVPGDRPERFAKAIAGGADAVILDLEDSVASAAREIASAQVEAFLAQHLADGKAATVWVRSTMPPRAPSGYRRAGTARRPRGLCRAEVRDAVAVRELEQAREGIDRDAERRGGCRAYHDGCPWRICMALHSVPRTYRRPSA